MSDLFNFDPIWKEHNLGPKSREKAIDAKGPESEAETDKPDP